MPKTQDDVRTGSGGAAVQVIEDLDALRAELDAVRARGERIALVPTMGNLHDGHLELVREAHALAGFVVATVFVNPFQFTPNEDFASYPRTFERDRELLAREGCHLVFAPQGATVYPRGPETITRVAVPQLGDILEGESRPGFFRGVATVVNILFNMVQPHVAMFGDKDYQQLLVIRRMVEDLRLRIRIEAVATVREADGLAMSSRNNYLTTSERERAPTLYRELGAIREAVAGGDHDYARLQTRAADALVEAGFRPDYVAVRRQNDLGLPCGDDDALIVLGAAWLGKARLIDNLRV
jgi:pantoate--beta-alanine ligase